MSAKSFFPRGLGACLALACFAGEMRAQAACAESRKGSTAVGILIGFGSPPPFDTSESESPNSRQVDTRPLVVAREDTVLNGYKVRSFNSTERTDPFSTLWILACGDRLTTRVVQHVLIPRKDGFWKLGTNTDSAEVIAPLTEDSTFSRPAAQMSFLWVAPLSETPRLRRIDPYDVTCSDLTDETTLTYVGIDFVGYTAFGSSTCAHYDESHSMSVESLDSIYAANATDRVSRPESVALLGASAAALHRRLNRAARSWESDCGEPGFESEAWNWTIMRRAGSWIGVVNFWGTGGGICGRYNEERVLRVGLPISVEPRRNPLPVTWSVIKKAVPGVTDATASPDQRLVVVLTNDRVVVTRVDHGTLRPLGEPVRVGGPWVMLKWASGERALLWDKAITGLPRLTSER